ncbi:DUF4367 domain-containing protein [Gracilibacillus xinjiangensis]|uniref:DUF4367 domain-containing protein n=1 Tax=Gracilibacillus xinjiangensis TaxID=1193282 RepID=A0ABV8WTK7_9BACI
MRKILMMMSLMLSLTVMGCSNQAAIPDGFHSYEKGEVKTAMEQLHFTPELPQYVPISAEIVVTDRFVDIHSEQEAFDITMFTTENDIFSIQIFDTDKTDSAATNQEVELADSNSAYYSDQPYSKSLIWEKDGITYKLTFRSGEHTLSKVDLIKVAESFQPS